MVANDQALIVNDSWFSVGITPLDIAWNRSVVEADSDMCMHAGSNNYFHGNEKPRQEWSMVMVVMVGPAEFQIIQNNWDGKKGCVRSRYHQKTEIGSAGWGDDV